MRVSLRSRLFFSFFIAMVIALIIPSVWARFAVQDKLVEEARLRALTEAYHLRVMLLVTNWSAHTLADFVYALGGELAQRMTLLDQQGKVVADSDVHPDALSAIDMQSDLQEIADALAYGSGTSVRKNSVSGREMEGVRNFV